jgi:MFS superfamily sulfate permease-like transporter
MLSAVALLMALILKLGFLADFLSQTVLVGFLTGVGFQVGIAVLGEMLGLEIQPRRTVGQFIEVVRSFSHIQLLTALISAVVVASIFTCHWFAPKVPAPLIAVVAVIAASKAWHFAERGVTVVGPVAGGLPSLGLPDTCLRY